MRYALWFGLVIAVLGGTMGGCKVGEKVETPNLAPNTFIMPGFPDENQTWLSNAVTFAFFGADPDNEVVAYHTRLEPALIDTLPGGEVDTLWPGDVGYYDPTPDTVVSFYDWERVEATITGTKGYQGMWDAYYRFLVKAVDEGDAEDPSPAVRHFLILAATWPEIVATRCPDKKEASPREYMQFKGVLGSLEPHEFEYSWTLIGPPDDPLPHSWTEWSKGVTEVQYSGFTLGEEYEFRVNCRIERAGTFIESKTYASCEFKIRDK